MLDLMDSYKRKLALLVSLDELVKARLLKHQKL
jgi:hypothetical protein